MPLKRKVIAVIVLLLLGVSITGCIINYIKNVHDTQIQLQNTSLPLSVDNIYTEVQQRMIEPLLVSSLMAHDTFLRDWMMKGESDVNSITRYLNQIQEKYDIFTTFLVSNKTKSYYHPRGVVDVLNSQNSADKWYFDFIQQNEPYEINLDHNPNLGDFLVMFINYKVMDYNNHLLGVTGVGIRLLNIEEMLGSFKAKYKYDVYFVDSAGEIILYSKGLNKRGNLRNIDGLKELQEPLFKHQKSQFEYRNKDGEYLLNTKYIEKLQLHLFVEINKDEYLTELKKTFYINIAISLLVTFVVALILAYTIESYQKQLVQLASEDVLTGLANRRKFNEHFEKMYKVYKKSVKSLTLILIDIDDFKAVNDTLGHLVGDDTLVRVAQILKKSVRSSDMVARWGGEEFAILLTDVTQESAHEIAQSICLAIHTDIQLSELLGKSISVSIGVGTLSSLESEDGLISKVDNALYAAKKAGKNQVVMA